MKCTFVFYHSVSSCIYANAKIPPSSVGCCLLVNTLFDIVNQATILSYLYPLLARVWHVRLAQHLASSLYLGPFSRQYVSSQPNSLQFPLSWALLSPLCRRSAQKLSVNLHVVLGLSLFLFPSMIQFGAVFAGYYSS